MNYYTLMGLMAGSMTDPPALAYANGTAGNDIPANRLFDGLSVVMFPAGAHSSDIHSVRVVELYDATDPGRYVSCTNSRSRAAGVMLYVTEGCNPASENRASFLMGGLISIFSALFSVFCYL